MGSVRVMTNVLLPFRLIVTLQQVDSILQGCTHYMIQEGVCTTMQQYPPIMLCLAEMYDERCMLQEVVAGVSCV